MRVNNGLTPQELEAYGISDVHDIVYNPSYDLLYQEELDPSLTGYERGVLTNLGAVAVDTGIFTGRSPKDKYIVRDDTTRDTFWWADKGKGKNDNKPLSPETWQHLKGLVTRQLSGKRLFVVDAFCGANPDTRLSVRFITEVAWQAHFVKNMFIRPSDEELAGFKPDFIVMNGAKCTNPQWKEQGLNSENFVAFNLTERMQLIGGTWYGGEMKKGMFSMMNTAGTMTACLTSKAAATQKLSSCRKKRNLKSTTLSVVMRCWKTSPCVKMALSTLMMVQKPRTPAFLIRSITSITLLSRFPKRATRLRLSS